MNVLASVSRRVTPRHSRQTGPDATLKLWKDPTSPGRDAATRCKESPMNTRPTRPSFHIVSALAVPVAGVVACIALATASLLPNVAVAEAPQITTASATDADSNGIGLLARATGLTEHQIRMVLGNRSAHAAYASTYDAVDARFRQAVGAEMYARIKLDRGLSVSDAQALAAKADARSAGHASSR